VRCHVPREEKRKKRTEYLKDEERKEMRADYSES
jgi:hypothetical protein